MWSTFENAELFTTLTSLTIMFESNWFSKLDDEGNVEEYLEECVAPLLSVLARQANLATLNMSHNKLSKSQA